MPLKIEISKVEAEMNKGRILWAHRHNGALSMLELYVYLNMYVFVCPCNISSTSALLNFSQNVCLYMHVESVRVFVLYCC